MWPTLSIKASDMRGVMGVASLDPRDVVKTGLLGAQFLAMKEHFADGLPYSGGWSGISRTLARRRLVRSVSG